MSEKQESLNFIEQFIEDDLSSGKHKTINTRFPPEPNGYLHIGHAKAICLNFEIAKKYGGKTNLRFDDTNPSTEETEYVQGIERDIKWLGYDWAGDTLYTSDYFPQLFDFAVKLIRKGLAYVDDSTAEEMAQIRGDTHTPGTNSPYRERPIEENLDLFERMKDGEFEDGSKALRAKIDMASPNMHMRDPVLYRIKKEKHHRTGDEWNIYPMYDFAHGQSDSIEHITHSLCSLEFKHHRPLYNWLIEQLEIYPSRQIEFARMNVAYMITSKRKLLKLVEEGLVTGWDDPRMPTIAGLRRKGYPPEAIRVFCDKVGMAKRDNLIEVELLESCVRDVLNQEASRIMVVMDPVKVVITNYPEGQVEHMSTQNNPEDPDAGDRTIPLSRELFIDRSDFMEDPPKKYYRLGPGRDVRLKSGYIIHCVDFKKDDLGNVSEIYCTHYPNSRSGEDTSGVKSKGVLQWVSAEHAKSITINLYDRLFTDPSPTSHEGVDYLDFLNPDALVVHKGALAEPSILDAKPGDRYQFMRIGYFNCDQDSTPENPIFNRTVTLKSSWKPK